MTAWLDWAALRGHGAYVWASVAALAVVVAVEIASLRRAHRRALDGIARRAP